MVNPTLLDLNAIVVEAEKMLRRLLGEDVELLTFLEPGLGTVKADSGQLEQILLNLAVNAREALPQGGKITIRTANIDVPREEILRKERGGFPVGQRENGDGFSPHAFGRENGDGVLPTSYVLLAVSDTGIGMSADVKARIWEPFFTTKEPGKGTGLGLAVVHGIVKQWDGHIEVESEPNAGTTFRIYFPRQDQSSRTMNPGFPHQPPPCGSETILLVEDEESVRILTRTILTACGYSVLEAANGEEALKLVQKQEHQLDLIVTDVVMPGLGGRNLVDSLLPIYPNAKVLYLSGYTGDVILRHGILHDEVPFLQKPFTPDALATKVRAVLDPF